MFLSNAELPSKTKDKTERKLGLRRKLLLRITKSNGFHNNNNAKG